MAAREAAGENLWTEQFDTAALVRLSEVFALFESPRIRGNSYDFGDEVARVLRQGAGWDVRHFGSEQLRQSRDHSVTADALAAGLDVLKGSFGNRVSENYQDDYVDLVNNLLRRHRISYKFIGGELVSFESDEMIREVVEPAVRLLVDQRFRAAQDSYADALGQISASEPANAITDAGTALQETLKALGCSGNALGPLITDAKKKGLFATHDQNLIAGVEKFLHWASADRSNSGDSHNASPASVADAWLMVHVVGALIVRLVDPEKRAGT